MTDRIVALLDGTLLDPDAPLLRADDLGVLRGDGIFETVLVVDGEPLELDAHLARLARSARMLDLPEPDAGAWRACAAAVAAAWTGGPEMVLKLVVTRGVEGRGVEGRAGAPTAFATGGPVAAAVLAQRRDGIAVVTLARGFAPDLAAAAPWLLIGAKTLSYGVNMAALRHAASVGADDVVFTATDGSVLEGPTSTVVVAHGRLLRTPPVEAGVLPGTTQGALFRAAPGAGWTVRVEPLAVADLRSADGLWLASSVRLLTRVHTLDGVPLAPERGLTGELTGLLPLPAAVPG